MQPRIVANAYAAGRLLIGAALAVAPRRAAAPWLGREASRPAAAVVTTAMGARDVAIGAGTLAALRRGDPAGWWLRTAAACDLADLVATVRARDHLPSGAVAGVAVLAAAGAATGAWLGSRLP